MSNGGIIEMVSAGVPHPIFRRFQSTEWIAFDHLGEIAPLNVAIYEENRSDEPLACFTDSATLELYTFPGFELPCH